MCFIGAQMRGWEGVEGVTAVLRLVKREMFYERMTHRGSTPPPSRYAYAALKQLLKYLSTATFASTTTIFSSSLSPPTRSTTQASFIQHRHVFIVQGRGRRRRTAEQRLLVLIPQSAYPVFQLRHHKQYYRVITSKPSYLLEPSRC